eukprot:m.279077 g.279077  ORF g.279077 m.279077 type:complete len:177 (-) comp16156_c0_seq4:1252-1782(-)
MAMVCVCVCVDPASRGLTSDAREFQAGFNFKFHAVNMPLISSLTWPSQLGEAHLVVTPPSLVAELPLERLDPVLHVINRRPCHGVEAEHHPPCHHQAKRQEPCKDPEPDRACTVPKVARGLCDRLGHARDIADRRPWLERLVCRLGQVVQDRRHRFSPLPPATPDSPVTCKYPRQS